jgi:hypothetical protein
MQPQMPAQYPPQFPTQPAAPAYPQQYPTQATAPAYQQYPPAAYPQQGYPQGYPQQYAAPAPPAAPPLPTGTLDSFYEQPASGGGPSFKFMDANRQPMIGKSYVGIVARPVTNADVRAQADQSGRPMTYKDGRPKFVLVVPMAVQPSPEFPEGVAGWWVKGQARDELARAMAEAGAPAGPPEAGAGIRVTLVGTRPVPGMNPAYQYRIEYMRPNGAAPAAVAPVTQPSTVPPVTPYAAANPGTGAYGDGPYIAPGTPTTPAPAPQPVAPAAPSAAPVGFSEEQAALFAKLTGQPHPAQQVGQQG